MKNELKNGSIKFFYLQFNISNSREKEIESLTFLQLYWN